ncbi:hypothetical protein ACPEIF_35040 [Streptomyces sp. NPDC012600]|uniref:hypothetical protein n=1 Tax=Streptomyces sp. NPDC012600 TaxID=3415005 RepID=UPI003C2D7A8A
MSAERRQRGVIFVHGLFSSGATWDPFRELVAQDVELQLFETLTFSYASRLAILNPLRRLPSFDDVADSLRGFLEIDAKLSCTEICGVPDARVTVLAKEIHKHHACTT